MSGIAAIYYKNEKRTNQKEILRILSKMSHRGSGLCRLGCCGSLLMGEQELVVGNGQAPGKTETNQKLEGEGKKFSPVCRGKNAIVMDGRVFNNNGVSNSSGETVLELYEKHGPECVHKIDGTFAFVIAGGPNGEDGNFLAARDGLGQKPLYYGKKGEALYFASELKALAKFVDTVNEFPNGHYYTPAEGFKPFKCLRRRSLTPVSNLKKASKTLAGKVKKVFYKYIKPAASLGALLSGGLDSSITAAVISNYVPLKTFCVGVEGSTDLEAARKVAGYLGTDHLEYTYSAKEAFQKLPEVIYHLESFDPLLVRSAVANYMAFAVAAEHADVVFSGEGADELFGGYDYFKNIDDLDELNAAMVECLGGLHNIGMQRVDRMSAAHGVECRVPFLDMELVNYAVALPAQWKIYGEDRVEKWFLRKAFEDYLPEEIAWRKKQQFSEGSGATKVLPQLVEEKVSDEEFFREKNKVDPPLRTKEEYYYFAIFENFFGREAASTVGRWVTASA